MIYGFVWSVAVSTVGFAVLVYIFGVPARLGIQSAVILLVCFLGFYLMMFFVRKHFQRSRDLRFGIFVTGLFYLVTGLLGMWYAGRLGLMQPENVRSHSLSFGIYMAAVMLTAILFLSFWKPK